MNKIAVVYWSGSGNTEKMAKAIVRGVKKTDCAVEEFMVDKFDSASLDTYDGFIFGCSAMGNEVLEESEFEPFFDEAEMKLQGKPVALFGSYGWGDGEWMRNWQDRVTEAGGKLYKEGLILVGAPDETGEKECEDFGEKFIKEY